MKIKLTLLLLCFCSSVFSKITFSTVNGTWEGWNGKNVVLLQDGSVWKQIEPYLSFKFSLSPKVVVSSKQGLYSSMLVDGEEEWVDVEELNSSITKITTSAVDGPWEGWNGENIILLQDGSVWKQIGLKLSFKFSLSPKVKISFKHGRYSMLVDGEEEWEDVERLR